MIRNSIFLVMFILSGCAFTVTKPPETIYTLMVSREAAQIRDSTIQQILAVPAPDMPVGLATDRIALYLSNGRRLDYYAGTRWAAPLDEILQDAIVTAGQEMSLVRVVMPGARLAEDYHLLVKIVDFAPVYHGAADHPPLIKITIQFMLLRMSERSVIADFTLSGSGIAESNSMTAIIDGMEYLFRDVLNKAYEKVEVTLSREK